MAGVCVTCWPEILGYKIFVTETLSIVLFDITQIVKTSSYVAWYPKFVFSKIFSAHTQFGEPSGCQNQGPKEILSRLKKILIFFKE